MKNLIRFGFVWTLLTVAGWSQMARAQVYDSGDDFGGDFSGSRETQAIVIINADGTAVLNVTSVDARATVEQRMRLMEQNKNRQDSADDDSDTPAPQSVTTNNTQPFTDEEITKKLNEWMEERDENSEQKSTVTVQKDEVITKGTRTFATPADLLRESYQIWNQGGLAVENARLETDTNGLLRLTLMPTKSMERYFKTYRSTLKLTGAKMELKIVFPGKVVTSGLPEMQTNATWIITDSKKDEALDALQKLNSAPVIIMAEAGGLKLAQPLDSKKLWRSQNNPGEDADLPPVKDSGPGFVAEAQAVTTTTLHVFPGGEQYFESHPANTGAVVSVKFFAPKGRTLKSVTGVRVLSAVDNQGRSVVRVESDDAEDDSSSEVTSGGSSDSSALSLDLRLQLPAADAQSIDKISAEAIATTIGTWKEMTLTNLVANTNNELDLSAVLPDAKLIIAKISNKNRQFRLSGTLKGPAAVKQLEIQAKKPDSDQFNSNDSGGNSSTKNGLTTRKINIQAWNYEGLDNDATASTNTIYLRIRNPQDLQRERVKFDLKALDLM